MRSQHRVLAELHAALMTLIDRLPPGSEARGPDSAWALIAFSMGTYLTKTLFQEAPSRTAELVDQLSLLLPNG